MGRPTLFLIASMTALVAGVKPHLKLPLQTIKLVVFYHRHHLSYRIERSTARARLGNGKNREVPPLFLSSTQLFSFVIVAAVTIALELRGRREWRGLSLTNGYFEGSALLAIIFYDFYETVKIIITFLSFVFYEIDVVN
ncbi:hypothetical protein TIFTF001_028293 [Ficus carica]|uniref:Uncharacterized protein n=1 Tax=Ficus carica TaxID=3494 RepID=A0AA88DQU9_FICCA|nr:hypothetical protein TIFTF001_028293 [Ficus carica]